VLVVRVRCEVRGDEHLLADVQPTPARKRRPPLARDLRQDVDVRPDVLAYAWCRGSTW
jgi:hypothetical protein